MRIPNFKLGWFVPQQVAALTHFHADVVQEDFMGIVQTGQTLLSDVTVPFHIIIDNRVVGMDAPAKLSEMQAMVPYMSHPQLRWVVVVKPTALDLATSEMAVERSGNVQLKNVDSLAEAIAHLKAVADVDWPSAETTFFPNANLASELT